MLTLDIAVAPRDRFEFWLRAVPGRAAHLLLRADDRVIWRMAAPGPTFRHHAWDTYETGTLTLEWEPGSVEVSFAYHYRPATVNETGITLLDFGAEGLVARGGDELATWLAADARRPRAHFSPARGWMNDPNGFCFHDGRYHLFYQFHPNSAAWGPMHWGHAASRDLLHWTHLPVFLHPATDLAALGASGGAFSGSALTERDGRLVFYGTERLPAYGNRAGYREIQRRIEPDEAIVAPRLIRTVLDTQPLGSGDDFRDPKAWIGEDGVHRMVLGSAVDGAPAVLLYDSDDGIDWRYRSVLYRAPDTIAANGGRAVECPDFFRLGDTWVLLVAFIGYRDPASGRTNLSFALTGPFDGSRFVARTPLQELDFGCDFYALQSCRKEGRQLAFAWLYNWSVKPDPDAAYCGEMCLPREVAVDGAGRVTLPPAREVQALFGAPIAVAEGTIAIAEPSFGIAVEGALDGLHVALETATGQSFAVRHAGGALRIETPEDGTATFASPPIALRSLLIAFDRGILEVFGNGGAVSATRRLRHSTDIVSATITGGETVTVKAFELRLPQKAP